MKDIKILDKIFFICLFISLSLAILSTGKAAWQDSLQVDGCIVTGSWAELEGEREIDSPGLTPPPGETVKDQADQPGIPVEIQDAAGKQIPDTGQDSADTFNMENEKDVDPLHANRALKDQPDERQQAAGAVENGQADPSENDQETGSPIIKEEKEEAKTESEPPAVEEKVESGTTTTAAGTNPLTGEGVPASPDSVTAAGTGADIDSGPPGAITPAGDEGAPVSSEGSASVAENSPGADERE